MTNTTQSAGDKCPNCNARLMMVDGEPWHIDENGNSTSPCQPPQAPRPVGEDDESDVVNHKFAKGDRVRVIDPRKEFAQMELGTVRGYDRVLDDCVVVVLDNDILPSRRLDENDLELLAAAPLEPQGELKPPFKIKFPVIYEALGIYDSSTGPRIQICDFFFDELSHGAEMTATEIDELGQFIADAVNARTPDGNAATVAEPWIAVETPPKHDNLYEVTIRGTDDGAEYFHVTNALYLHGQWGEAGVIAYRNRPSPYIPETPGEQNSTRLENCDEQRDDLNQPEK